MALHLISALILALSRQVYKKPLEGALPAMIPQVSCVSDQWHCFCRGCKRVKKVIVTCIQPSQHELRWVWIDVGVVGRWGLWFFAGCFVSSCSVVAVHKWMKWRGQERKLTQSCSLHKTSDFYQALQRRAPAKTEQNRAVVKYTLT